MLAQVEGVGVHEATGLLGIVRRCLLARAPEDVTRQVGEDPVDVPRTRLPLGAVDDHGRSTERCVGHPIDRILGEEGGERPPRPEPVAELLDVRVHAVDVGEPQRRHGRIAPHLLEVGRGRLRGRRHRHLLHVVGERQVGRGVRHGEEAEAVLHLGHQVHHLGRVEAERGVGPCTMTTPTDTDPCSTPLVAEGGDGDADRAKGEPVNDMAGCRGATGQVPTGSVAGTGPLGLQVTRRLPELEPLEPEPFDRGHVGRSPGAGPDQRGRQHVGVDRGRRGHDPQPPVAVNRTNAVRCGCDRVSDPTKVGNSLIIRSPATVLLMCAGGVPESG